MLCICCVHHCLLQGAEESDLWEQLREVCDLNPDIAQHRLQQLTTEVSRLQEVEAENSRLQQLTAEVGRLHEVEAENSRLQQRVADLEALCSQACALLGKGLGGFAGS